MKRLLIAFGIAAMSLTLQGCIDDDDDDDDRATMCYSISGSTITVNCKTNRLGSCSDDGKSSLGEYHSWDDCWDDTTNVTNNFRDTGTASVGPGAIGSGGTGGSTDGGTGGSTGGSMDCDSAWTGSPDDHARFHCQTACVYKNAGSQEAVDATCSILSGFSAAARSACRAC